MRLGPKQPSKAVQILKLIIVLLIVLSFLYFLLTQRVNKFEFEGDIEYSDISKIKISALNLLKDQNILFFDKKSFEEEIKNENPEIKEVQFKILGLDKILIKIKVIDKCCVIKDTNESLFLISKEGKVLKKLSVDSKVDSISLTQEISGNENFNVNLLFKIDEIKTQFQAGSLKLNGFKIKNNILEVNLSDGATLIIDQDTDVSEIENKYKSLISHASQNQKKYSIVDFRFDKVVAK